MRGIGVLFICLGECLRPFFVSWVRCDMSVRFSGDVGLRGWVMRG